MVRELDEAVCASPSPHLLCLAITIFLQGTSQAKTQLLSHLHRTGFTGEGQGELFLWQ